MAKESHDQKRKRKLEQRKRRESQVESLAYLGDKYKRQELIPTLMHAEIGIYQAYIITKRQLVDLTVVAAIERLIRAMRSGTLPPPPDPTEVLYEIGREEDLVIEQIRRNWADHFAKKWQPPKDELIGILRTILGSMEKVKAPGSRSQGYLRHIAGFLTKKLGLSVQPVSPDLTPLPEPDEDELVVLGRDWYEDGDLDARAEFFDLAVHLVKTGETTRVINATHTLIGEIADAKSAVFIELFALNQQARRAVITAMS